jgi:tetratricopeptide (TPR) repeat protein
MRQTMMDANLPDFDKLWDYRDPAATEQKFSQLLASVDTSFGQYRCELLTQIARSQGLQGKFDAASSTLQLVAQAMQPNWPVVRVRYLLESGRVHNSSGHRDLARPLFVEAFELASEQKLDFYAVDAAHMMGIAEIHEKQMEWNERALAIAEASDDPRARRWAGSLYNNMGWTLFEARQYERALALFRKGVDFQAANNRPRELRIAKYSVAKTLRMMGKVDDALAIDRAIHEEAVVANDPDGYVSEEIGECLLAQGHADEARPFFKEAFELLSKDDWLVQREPDRVKRLGELAK